jgi:hypothetical protein
MKTKKTKLNVRLLRRIQKQILKEPRQFQMPRMFDYRPAIPNCGTAACIAGWAYTFSLKNATPERARQSAVRLVRTSALDIAQEKLGLDIYQAHRLFNYSQWPFKFNLDSNNPKQAVARIEHFINTEGAE